MHTIATFYHYTFGMFASGTAGSKSERAYVILPNTVFFISAVRTREETDIRGLGAEFGGNGL